MATLVNVPSTTRKRPPADLPALYWVTRDHDARKGLSAFVEFWREKPILMDTEQEGQIWIGPGGFDDRLLIERAIVVRLWHSVPETGRECLRVGT